jgi:dinuclear metal center YbgI/SA1388 family protein
MDHLHPVPLSDMTDAKTLGQAFDALLQPEKFRDYGPNGLQVEGDREVRLLVSGVTASRALIEAVIEAQADAIVVHHGLFWRGQDGRVTGWMRERLRLLLAHGIHLFAYHLPLDAHPELGNNAQLARVLGLQTDGRFGEQDLGFVGTGAQNWAGPQALAEHVAAVLARPVTCVGGSDRPVRRVAWCTGGAQSYFESAIAQGVDAFITGEISEPQAHLARETGVAFLACGHHATERYGAPALGAHVAQALGITHRFIEIDNPA